MADGEKSSEAKVEPEAAGDDEITFLDWDVQLTEVQRVEPDAESDDLDDLFTVTFAVDGPNADASVEIMVTEAADIERAGMSNLNEGQKLSYEMVADKRSGKMSADKIQAE